MDPIKSKRVPRFVEEYAKDRNGTQAALRAGYSQNVDSAGSIAARLLSDVRIQALIAEQIEKVSEEALYTAKDLLRDWIEVASVDTSRIVKVRRVNCRHCWGEGHAYQWNLREFSEVSARAMDDGAMPPDCAGGFGWRQNAEPNPECPECCGEGLEDVHIADMETLTAAERKMIAGVKRTKDGIEVKLKDQEAVRARIAQHLGMLIERKELTGKDGRPLMMPAVPADLPTDPEALAAAYQKLTGSV
jgi:phage terminase small subunit